MSERSVTPSAKNVVMFKRRVKTTTNEDIEVGYCFYCGDVVYEGEEVIDDTVDGEVMYHHACYDEDLLEEI